MSPAERQRARRERLAQEYTAEDARVADAIEIARLRAENASLRERLLATERRLDRLLENVTFRDAKDRHEVTNRDVTATESEAPARLARGSQDLSSEASSMLFSAEEREREETLSLSPTRCHDPSRRDVTEHQLGVDPKTLRGNAIKVHEAIVASSWGAREPEGDVARIARECGGVLDPAGLDADDLRLAIDDTIDRIAQIRDGGIDRLVEFKRKLRFRVGDLRRDGARRRAGGGRRWEPAKSNDSDLARDAIARAAQAEGDDD